MEARSYRVAGFCFRVWAREDLLDAMDNLSPFRVSGEPSNPVFSLLEVPQLPQEASEPLFCTQDGPGFPEIAIWEVPEGYLFRMRPLPEKPVAAWLVTNPAFSEARVSLCGTDNRFGLNNSLMLLYAFSTACKGALEMHSSVVMCGGKGFLFLGRSGTGKSTHSRLWLENVPGAELLNDDNPILRQMPDGSFRVFGSPWSGKTPCYKAKDVPAHAVVRIRQAPFNAIHRHSPLEAYASLMASASAFRPFKDLSDGWHRTLEAAASHIPSFTLDCLPNAEAALLCHQEVYD